MTNSRCPLLDLGNDCKSNVPSVQEDICNTKLDRGNGWLLQTLHTVNSGRSFYPVPHFSLPGEVSICISPIKLVGLSNVCSLTTSQWQQ